MRGLTPVTATSGFGEIVIEYSELGIGSNRGVAERRILHSAIHEIWWLLLSPKVIAPNSIIERSTT